MDSLIVYKSYYPKCRVGTAGDGGYIIANLPGDSNYDVLISCGVADDINFEIEFLRTNNVPCLAFDGTVSQLPPNNNDSIKFIKKNINPGNTQLTTNLHDEIAPYNNVFLKMDIETFEFRWLNTLSTDQMNKFKQIVIEFHFPFTTGNFTHLDINMPVDYKMAIFKKLAKTHKLIHFHANNCCGTTIYNNIRVPNVFECTYIRNDVQALNEFNKESIPSPLDYKNTSNPEIHLNYWPFVSQ